MMASRWRWAAAETGRSARETTGHPSGPTPSESRDRSKLYGTFIPIAYPTREQASNGHSGSALGIHGPPRGQSEPEYPTTAFDWTMGCVATGTDSDVETIAEFVRRYQPTLLVR